MKTEININKHIITKTYNLKNDTFFTYVCNPQDDVCYILKGCMSELFDKIVLTQDYEKVIDHATENNLIEALNYLFLELTNEKIIFIDKKIDKLINKSVYESLILKINMKEPNYKYFADVLRNILETNGVVSRLYLELTNRCNLACKHCCNHKNRNNCEIDYNTAKKIIDDAIENLNIYKVILTGGECTLNKDFLKIAKYVKKKRLGLKILTNAVNLYDDKKLFNKIIDICPSEIQISLYSMNSQVHDNMTNVVGSHEKTLQVIKKLKEKNIKTCITNFQSSYNVDSYEEISEYAKSIDSEFISSCVFINNHENSNQNAKLNEEKTEEFYKKTLNIENPRNFQKNDTPICVAGAERISISPNLDICPCIYFEYKLGNYKDTNFKYLNEKILPNFRKTFVRNNLKECFEHEYCNCCFYCPTISQFDTGFLKKTEMLCSDARAYYNALKKLEINRT